MQQRLSGAANPGSAHNTGQTAARERVQRKTGPPRSHTAPTACGYLAPAACPKDRRSGVAKRLTPDAPHPGKGRPPPGHPGAAPTARRASVQERAHWGW